MKTESETGPSSAKKEEGTDSEIVRQLNAMKLQNEEISKTLKELKQQLEMLSRIAQKQR